MKRGRTRRRRHAAGKKGRPEFAVPVFGHKNHLSTDRRHGLIREWAVSDAAEHDSHRFRALLDEANTASPLWADTADRSAEHGRRLADRGFTSKVRFRTPPGKPLEGVRAKADAARARVRARVEHVFAAQKHRMGLFVRTIGLARARTKIGLANLVYNVTRFAWLERQVVPV